MKYINWDANQLPKQIEVHRAQLLIFKIDQFSDEWVTMKCSIDTQFGINPLK